MVIVLLGYGCLDFLDVQILSMQDNMKPSQGTQAAGKISDTPLEAAQEAVYEALAQDNENIDACIDALKAAMQAAGTREAVFEPGRLPHPNREGRKTMQAYFRRRGVAVRFA